MVDPKGISFLRTTREKTPVTPPTVLNGLSVQPASGATEKSCGWFRRWPCKNGRLDGLELQLKGV